MVKLWQPDRVLGPPTQRVLEVRAVLRCGVQCKNDMDCWAVGLRVVQRLEQGVGPRRSVRVCDAVVCGSKGYGHESGPYGKS